MNGKISNMIDGIFKKVKKTGIIMALVSSCEGSMVAKITNPILVTTANKPDNHLGKISV